MISRLRAIQERKESGFTMSELLVVMLIIGILSAFAIPVYLRQQDKALDSAVKSDLSNAARGADTYYTDHLSYPTTADGFASDDIGPSASPSTSYTAFVGDRNYVIYGASKSGKIFRFERRDGQGPAVASGLNALPTAPTAADTAAGITSTTAITWAGADASAPEGGPTP